MKSSCCSFLVSAGALLLSDSYQVVKSEVPVLTPRREHLPSVFFPATFFKRGMH